MILALALIALQAASPAEEIVVTGKARALHVSVQLDSKRRVTACQIAQTSGDDAFDKLTCETVAACSREEDRSHDAVQACTQKSMLSVVNDQYGPDAQKPEANQ